MIKWIKVDEIRKKWIKVDSLTLSKEDIQFKNQIKSQREVSLKQFLSLKYLNNLCSKPKKEDKIAGIQIYSIIWSKLHKIR